MNYTEAKNTLERLHDDLHAQYIAAQRDMANSRYTKASESLAAAVVEAHEITRRVSSELVTSALSDLESRSLEASRRTINELVITLSATQKTANAKAVIATLEAEQKVTVSRQYHQLFEQLCALEKQPVPFDGVKVELNAFLKKVKEFHQNESISESDLTEVLNAAQKRLNGGKREEFDAFINNLQARHSIPLKVLGTALILLGAALIASAIFFAPAVITAASVGLGTIYAATAGVTLTSSALLTSGTACFFAKTDRMKLADSAKNFSEELENPRPQYH